MNKLPLPVLVVLSGVLGLFGCGGSKPAAPQSTMSGQQPGAPVSVSVSTPTNGANVPSPVQMAATASSGNPIATWDVSADGSPILHQTGNALNASLALGTGTHTLVVQATDTTGASGTESLSIKVEPPPPPAPPPAMVSVTVTSPTAGATLLSPVQVTARAKSSNPITSWAVYADNAAVLQQSGAALAGNITLAAGAHALTIRAWDSSGAFGSQDVSITVPSTTVFNHIEDMSGWGECGNRACAGGADATTFWMAPFQTSPALDGSSAEFYIAGPAYADALHWKKLGLYNAATNYQWDLWFYADDASLTAQALEFDLFTVIPINGQNQKFMFGSQCDYAAGVWDGWNEPNGQWIHTKIPCSKFTTNTWHHVVWNLQRTGANHASLDYVSLAVDGTVYPLDLIEPSAPTTWQPVLGVQFQQDEGPSGTAFHQWVDEVTLTIW